MENACETTGEYLMQKAMNLLDYLEFEVFAEGGGTEAALREWVRTKRTQFRTDGIEKLIVKFAAPLKEFFPGTGKRREDMRPWALYMEGRLTAAETAAGLVLRPAEGFSLADLTEDQLFRLYRYADLFHSVLFSPEPASA